MLDAINNNYMFRPSRNVKVYEISTSKYLHFHIVLSVYFRVYNLMMATCVYFFLYSMYACTQHIASISVNQKLMATILISSHPGLPEPS
jgi:hypothetical protein